jgi:hypothetical protein
VATSKTIGTAATSTLWTTGAFSYGGPTQADMAIIQAGILDDSVPSANPLIASGAYIPGQGQLLIPNRGILQVLKGDWIALDPVTGWPMLISARAAASASFVHT